VNIILRVCSRSRDVDHPEGRRFCGRALLVFAATLLRASGVIIRREQIGFDFDLVEDAGAAIRSDLAEGNPEQAISEDKGRHLELVSVIEQAGAMSQHQGERIRGPYKAGAAVAATLETCPKLEGCVPVHPMPIIEQKYPKRNRDSMFYSREKGKRRWKR
jgi:hypothetical protein